MIHRFVDLPQRILGTLFAVNDQVWNGSTDEDDSNLWYVPIGAPAGTGEGSCVQITFETPALFGTGNQRFWWWAIPSLNRAKLLAQHSDDAADNTSLWVMNADGSGQTMVFSGVTNNPQWLGTDALVYFDNADLTKIKRVNADGSGTATLLSKASNIAGFNPSPDGTKLAYTWNGTLGVVDADGSNDTTLVASGVVTSGTSSIWTLDGARILYWATGAPGIRIIDADGSNDTQLVASGVTGFYYPCGMAGDRMWYTDTSTFSNWRPAYIMLDGSGATIVSPNRRLSQAVQRAVCVWDEAQGRMFSVLHSSATGSTGVDSIFSILPDGSDFRIHFEALEETFVNPGDNFQNLSFR